jgi:hypothetical protein
VGTLEIVAAVIVGVLSAARITRLLTQDTFPPAVWVRQKWDALTDDGPWSTLVHCHWCFGPWAALAVLLWGLLTDFHTPWWVFNGWLAGAYLTSMVVERDEKD